MEDPFAQPELSAARPRAARPNLFNLLAAVLVVLSCLSALCQGFIFLVPTAVPASLRPVDLPELALLPTLVPTTTPSPTSVLPTLPPEWTATNTPTITPTPTASNTPTATPSLTPRGPTRTPPPTATPTLTPSRTPRPSPTGPTPTPSNTRSPFPYTLQKGNPTYLANFANSSGCKWQGIAGQAFNLQGQSQVGLLVHLEGGGISLDTLTGSKPAYGPAGYEFVLNQQPVQTTDTFRIQLRTNAGQPQSDVYVIPTFTDCAKNLILVNFVQNR